MFGWWKKDAASGDNGIPEIDRHTSLDGLLEQDLLVLFKHSPACPVSWAAHAQVSRFRSHHPEVPICLVSVIKEREFSRQIAERVKVRHESPQILVLRRGVVDSVASHGEITESRLAAMLSVA